MWHAVFISDPIFIFFISFASTSFSALYRICMCVCVCVCVCIYIYTYIHTYIHKSDYVQTVYELPLLPNNTASEIFYTNLERYEVLTGYLSLSRQPGGDWANT